MKNRARYLTTISSGIYFRAIPETTASDRCGIGAFADATQLGTCGFIGKIVLRYARNLSYTGSRMAKYTVNDDSCVAVNNRRAARER